MVYCLQKREAAPRIELIETARPLFQSFELTGHALQIQSLELTRYPLSSFVAGFENPKIGETAADERRPLDSLFEVAPEAGQREPQIDIEMRRLLRMDVGNQRVVTMAVFE
jgi:hypothetical protein